MLKVLPQTRKSPNLVNTEEADVVLLQETYLNERHSFELKNYTTYRSDRSSHGGGVAIAIHKGIKHILVVYYITNSIENISIQLNINNKPTLLTSAYSPNYSPSFTCDMKKITPHNKNFIALAI